MYKQITYEQRIQLDLLLNQRKSKTEIATLLGITRKSIYNELNRNSSPGAYKKYTARQAQNRRDARRVNSNRKIIVSAKVIAILEDKIGHEQWSPEQVAGRCKVDGIEMVSTETIYKYIYTVDKAKGGNLLSNLR